MWRLGPERRVFIDGRNMVYGESFYRRYRTALLNPKRWEELIGAHAFEWIILRHTSVDMEHVVRWLYREPSWALCYFDETGVVFVRRNGVNASVAEQNEKKLADTPPSERAMPDVHALLTGQANVRGDARRDTALGGFFRKLGLHHRAMDCLTRAVKVDPRNPNTLSDLGGLCFKLGRRPDAEGLFQAALAIDPGHLTARRNLGNLCIVSGRFDDAVYHYTLALKQTPNDARLHSNLAHAYAKRRDLPRAMDHYRRALAMAPNYRPPAYSLASVLMDQQRYQEAASVCGYVLAQDPNDKVAKSQMERIRRLMAGK